MSADTRSKVVGRWAVRIAGLAVFFLFAAAPLPGETPGCEAPGMVDPSATLIDDESDFPRLRVLCGKHCYADCNRLVECGVYLGPARGPGYAACVTDCTGAGGRDCTTWTVTGFCPPGDYPGFEITENEELDCETDAGTAACWCSPGADCFVGGELPVPYSCTARGLCDPR